MLHASFMARKIARSLLGPSPLSQFLKNLQKPPALLLPGITALKLKLATRNDHFGARYDYCTRSQEVTLDVWYQTFLERGATKDTICKSSARYYGKQGLKSEARQLGFRVRINDECVVLSQSHH
jgi:hypothetical protein